MVVHVSYDGQWRGSGRCVIDFMACPVKNKEQFGIQGVHSVLGCMGSCRDTSRKKLKKIK